MRSPMGVRTFSNGSKDRRPRVTGTKKIYMRGESNTGLFLYQVDWKGRILNLYTTHVLVKHISLQVYIYPCEMVHLCGSGRAVLDPSQI